MFTADSPEAYLEEQSRTHPLSIGAGEMLAPTGRLPELEARALACLRAGNERPDAFAVTSRYRVLVITP